MTSRGLVVAFATCLWLLCLACQAAEVPPVPGPPAAPAAAAAHSPVAPISRPTLPEQFGAPFATEVPEVSLSSLIADPKPYAGQIVQTHGTVSQVCQAAGCWMELAAAGTDERVRTPMAGHAFFLPKTIVGKRARVQGRVELIALSDQAKQHLEAEGAHATGSTLSLSAFSVAVQ